MDLSWDLFVIDTKPNKLTKSKNTAFTKSMVALLDARKKI
jgi:hypothetical protein